MKQKDINSGKGSHFGQLGSNLSGSFVNDCDETALNDEQELETSFTETVSRYPRGSS